MDRISLAFLTLILLVFLWTVFFFWDALKDMWTRRSRLAPLCNTKEEIMGYIRGHGDFMTLEALGASNGGRDDAYDKAYYQALHCIQTQ